MKKIYPGSRICAIDFYPLFLEALKETYGLSSKFNLEFKTSGRGSKDIHKFFYHYCLEKFCSGYKLCSSAGLPKVLVIYPLPKHVLFTDKNLSKVLKVLPVPWVKCTSFDSPDVEMACIGALSKNINSNRKLNNFASKHTLYNFLTKIKKSKTFSQGTVDLPEEDE